MRTRTTMLGIFNSIGIVLLLTISVFGQTVNVGKVKPPEYLSITKERGKVIRLPYKEYKKAQKKAEKIKSQNARNVFWQKFTDKHGIYEYEACAAYQAYYDKENGNIIETTIEELNIKDSKTHCWGPAAAYCGVVGTIGGERVIWYDGKLYKDGTVPRNYYTKCLPGSTLIATPNGNVAIKDLVVGDTIYTSSVSGKKIKASILDRCQLPVANKHSFVQFKLKDGRELIGSP